MSAGSPVSGFFHLVWKILDGIRKVLSLVLLLVIFGFVLAALHTSIPVVPRVAALVIAPEGELVEQLSSDPLRRAVGQATGGAAPETLLRDVVDAIEAAKDDSRIKLMVLDVGNLSPSGSRNSRRSAPRSAIFAPPASASSPPPTRSTRPSSTSHRKPASCTSIRSASCSSTASATTGCSSRTRSRSSASTSMYSARAPSRATPINTRAATWRPPSVKRVPHGSACSGARTRAT